MWLPVLAVSTVSMAVAANAMCTANNCMNGYCSISGTCTCLNGYTKDPYGRCILFERCAAASCQNGFCSPITFVCSCRDGYFKDTNGNCVRTEMCRIDSCKNGICSKGGHCYCRTGFFKGPNGECLAVGLCTPSMCANGDCDPVTQECKCKPGYTKDTNGQCIGYAGSCQLTCTNGQCARLMDMQEVCYCDTGFQRDATKLNTCVKANAGGEREVEGENEKGSTSTTTTTRVPALPLTHHTPVQQNVNTITAPVPQSPSGLTQPRTQVSSNGAGGYGNSYASQLELYRSMEARIMALYIRLMSFGRLLEAIS